MKGESMARRFLSLAFAFSLILTIPLGLQGQTTGKVEGVVRDADTGAPLVGAQVTIEGTLLGNITNDDGYYFILNVPAGLRSVKAQLIGYQTVTVEDQRILAGQTQTVDFDLKSTVIELPGQVVQGERSPLVPRDNTVSKQRITVETTQAIPADNYRDIVTLQAGVVRFGDAGNSQFQISVRGGRTSENAVYVDGINVRRYQTDQNLLDVPEFGVEEIDVITGAAGSQFGDAQSGVINIVTREGGQDFSGQLRIETDEFNPSSSNYGYNRGQFSIGGPIPVADNLTFFFSSDVVGKGARRPRAAGFKGTTDDLFDVAARFSNADEVRQFLGHDLDLAAMMRTAERNNPALPILNLDSFRRARFGGTDYEGRLPGNQGDEFRIQGKIAYQPTRNVKLIGTYLEDRDQGLIFSRRRYFWTEERNRGYVNRNRLGIIGYDQTLSQSAERSTSIAFRGSYQRFERHTGDIFAPFDSSKVANPGASLGYHDGQSILNFMFQDIPIFGEDLWATRPEDAELFENVTVATNSRADNPFGIQTTFFDQNKGFTDVVFNGREDRANFRLDFDSQINRVHRLRAGAEVKAWQLQQYSSNLSSATFLDVYRAKPDMESFYIEDRLDYQDLVIDLGLRVDSFNAGVSYPSVFGDQDSPFIEPDRKTEVAPRLGVAHPVTERTQVRVSYGTKFQVPQFSNLYDGINIDVDQQGNTNAFFGNPDLGFRKTTSFEVGFTTLLSENWVLDLVGYNRDFDGNISARYLQQEGSTRFLRIFANADHGNVRGLDTTLRKRFSDYFSTDFTYTLLFSKSTGTDPEDFVRNEGRFVVGDEPPLPPIQPAPNDFDQTHTFNTQFNLQFPSDFREGTRLGSVLRNTGLYLTFQANSGRPYTRQALDNFEFIEDLNLSRRGWQSIANLRVTRDFSFAGLEYTAFADIRNLFDTDNLSANQLDVFSSAGVSNGVYQTTGSPFTDGKTISDALDFMGISTPDFYVSPNDPSRTPTDIDGDGDRDDDDRAEIIRRLDMDGDGQVTIEEELAMAILSIGAYDANPNNFDIPRLFRLGLEIKF
jgi:outer membrane receptor protein involved in Fe transport